MATAGSPDGQHHRGGGRAGRLGPLLVLALAVAPAGARANMAAPGFRRTAPPSAAPSRPEGEAPVVRSETLTFQVRDEGSAVEAEYLLEAAGAADLALRFLSPEGSRGVRAWVNGEEQPVITSPLDPKAPEVAPRAGGLAPFEPLFQSAFSAPLRAGENRVRVAYQQGYGLYWIPFGYFRDPGYLRVYPYELWPLKGWELAPDFHLDLEVTVALPRAGFWARLFGAVPSWSLQVAGADREGSVEDWFRGPWLWRSAGPPERGDRAGRFIPVAEPVSGKLLGGSLRLAQRLGPDLPDRLFVVVDKLGDRGTR